MLQSYSDDNAALKVLLGALVNFLIECAQNRSKISSEDILLVLVTLYRSQNTSEDNQSLVTRAVKNLIGDGW